MSKIMNKNFKDNRELIKDLGMTEKIIIWSIREWKISILTAKDPIPKLVYGLKQLSLQDISISLDKLLRAILTLTLKPIDVRCHCSKFIGETEKEVLLAISFYQNKNFYKIKEFTYHKEIEYEIEYIANILYEKNIFFSINKDKEQKFCEEKKVIYYNFNKNNTLH